MTIQECYASFGGDFDDVRQRIPKDELIQIFRNKAAVNEGLVKVEGSPLVESWYWTSEEYGKGNKTKKSWFVSMEDSNFYYLDWTEPIYVRAVSAF